MILENLAKITDLVEYQICLVVCDSTLIWSLFYATLLFKSIEWNVKAVWDMHFLSAGLMQMFDNIS